MTKDRFISLVSKSRVNLVVQGIITITATVFFAWWIVLLQSLGLSVLRFQAFIVWSAFATAFVITIVCKPTPEELGWVLLISSFLLLVRFEF